LSVAALLMLAAMQQWPTGSFLLVGRNWAITIAVTKAAPAHTLNCYDICHVLNIIPANTTDICVARLSLLPICLANPFT
jgi:hypothetical protein